MSVRVDHAVRLGDEQPLRACLLQAFPAIEVARVAENVDVEQGRRQIGGPFELAGLGRQVQGAAFVLMVEDRIPEFFMEFAQLRFAAILADVLLFFLQLDHADIGTAKLAEKMRPDMFLGEGGPFRIGLIEAAGMKNAEFHIGRKEHDPSLFRVRRKAFHFDIGGRGAAIHDERNQDEENHYGFSQYGIAFHGLLSVMQQNRKIIKTRDTQAGQAKPKVQNWTRPLNFY